MRQLACSDVFVAADDEHHVKGLMATHDRTAQMRLSRLLIHSCTFDKRRQVRFEQRHSILIIRVKISGMYVVKLLVDICDDS